MPYDPVCVGLAEDVLDFLNTKYHTHFLFRTVNGKLTPHAVMILARFEEGATPEQCRQIIVRKLREWGDNDRMRKFLRPATLFNRKNFHSYLGELGSNL